MQNGKPVSKTLTVQLLDRNGNKKAEAEVVHNGNKFCGLITAQAISHLTIISWMHIPLVWQ